jgi:hypothetical protein
MENGLPAVIEKLRWLREQRIWPHGPRYLWTDAFGVVLLVSLFRELQEEQYLAQALWVVSEVDRVLGRPLGIRIGEAPDRDGQYFHYLAMWLYALGRLGRVRPEYRERAIELARQVHPRFVRPGVGVFWKMEEDLRRPYPGYGFGILDAFHGCVVYRTLAPRELAGEIAQMRELAGQTYQSLEIRQDLGLGLMLWFTHFFPGEPWALVQKQRSLATLDRMWVDPPGYFCRYPNLPQVKFAFTNYGVSLGLQAVGADPDRVKKLHAFFRTYKSGDEYDTDAITHIMACASHFPGEFVRPEL